MDSDTLTKKDNQSAREKLKDLSAMSDTLKEKLKTLREKAAMLTSRKNRLDEDLDNLQSQRKALLEQFVIDDYDQEALQLNQSRLNAVKQEQLSVEETLGVTKEAIERLTNELVPLQTTMGNLRVRAWGEVRTLMHSNEMPQGLASYIQRLYVAGYQASQGRMIGLTLQDLYPDFKITPSDISEIHKHLCEEYGVF